MNEVNVSYMKELLRQWHGGSPSVLASDLAQALEHAVELLETSDWTKDILVRSNQALGLSMDWQTSVIQSAHSALSGGSQQSAIGILSEALDIIHNGGTSRSS